MKRIVHITEEIVFDEIIDSEETKKSLDLLLIKWKKSDFSKNLYFNKQTISKYPGGPKVGTGFMEFIKATKPKQ
jgi:hypothetical protein